jgi:hypothetical protein
MPRTIEEERLIKAARDGNVMVVNAALTTGADIEAVDANGFTALMSAAAKTQSSVVSTLLAAGANIEATLSTPSCTTNRMHTYITLSSASSIRLVFAQCPYAGSTITPSVPPNPSGRDDMR